MTINLRKDRVEILRTALDKLQRQTPITATSPGSVARALTETITTELGDFYDLMDYNISQTLISTATGPALDKIGRLYNVERKSLNEINIVDANTNTFYFYLDNPHHDTITIPAKTNIYSKNTGYVSAQIRFQTVSDTVIPAGRRKVFTAIRPHNNSLSISIGKETLTVHDFVSPAGVLVKCTNAKAIESFTSRETDDNYRSRIINQLRVNAGGTLTAMRFAALAVDGVREARIANARYGLGSVEMLVVSEDSLSSDRIRASVSAALEPVRPAGVRLYLKNPTPVTFDVSIGLVANPRNESEQRELVSRATLALRLYLNSFLPGDTIVYNQLIQRVLEVSDLITDLRVINFATNGSEISRANFTPAYDEQIVPGTISVRVL